MQQQIIISEQSQAFRRRVFPDTSELDWSDWRWQLRNRFRDVESISRVIDLSDDERRAIRRRQGMLPLGVTPYYASLLDANDPLQSLRRTKIPSMAEFDRSPGEVADPLGEDAHSPVPGIVHTYPDKVLFLVSDFCATYCRYCTRGRMVGGGEFPANKLVWEGALDYIRKNTGIRDVLLSGGDPLILSDERLDWLLSRLQAIEHVEILRIGTKVPAVLPQRVTPELLNVLRRYHPLFMSLHFVHPDELTKEVGQACGELANIGIPLAGQMVLLKGVNNQPETIMRLCNGLLKIRVKPYYLHQCDPIEGSGHFRTSVSEGIKILEYLHGRTTGYAIPMYMIDAPGGGGKVPISPNYVVGRDGDDLLLRNYMGEEYRYWDPENSIGRSI